MNKRLAVGIDLGTSTSLAAIFKDGKPALVQDPNSLNRSPIIPSLVALDRNDTLMVGEEARPYVDLEGRGVREVKRNMEAGKPIILGGKSYRPEEISALILKKLKENIEILYGQPVTDVVLSVPAIFTNTGIVNTKQAGNLAGLNILHVMSEPTAAALAFGIEHMDIDERILVFDFGGGTLDVSVVELVEGAMQVTCTYGNPQLGGKDFDEVMINLILETFHKEVGYKVQVNERSLRQLKGHAEKCKISLSGSESAFVEVFNFGLQDGYPVDLEVEITQAGFNRMIRPLVEEARECVAKTLAAKDLKPGMIDRVLLVGGTTYIPAVREMLAKMFTCDIRFDVPPDLAVAMGTAIRAGMLKGATDPRKDVIIAESWAYGLGIELVTWRDNQFELTYGSLIEPNIAIPHSVRRSYSLLHSDQAQVEVRVRQTTNRDAYFLGDTIDTGKAGYIRNIPVSNTGEPHPIEVEFSIDTDKIINVKAIIPATGQELELEFSLTDLQLTSEQQIATAKDNVDEIWAKSRGRTHEE